MAITLEDHGLVGGGFSAGNTIDIKKMGLATSDNKYLIVAKDATLPNDANAILATYDDFIIVLYTNGNVAKCKKNNSSDINYIEEWSVNTNQINPDQIRRLWVDGEFLYIVGNGALEKININEGSYEIIDYGLFVSVNGSKAYFYNNYFFVLTESINTPPYELSKISTLGEVISKTTININTVGYDYYGGRTFFVIKDNILITPIIKSGSYEVSLVFLDILSGNEIARTIDISYLSGSTLEGFSFDLVGDHLVLIIQSPSNLGTEYIKYNISPENASIVSSDILSINYNSGDNSNLYLSHGFSKDKSGNILFNELPTDPNDGKICFIKEDGTVIKGGSDLSNTFFIKQTNRIDDNSEYLSCYAFATFNAFKEIIVNPKIQVD